MPIFITVRCIKTIKNLRTIHSRDQKNFQQILNQTYNQFIMASLGFERYTF
jgi:hypothetical protein